MSLRKDIVTALLSMVVLTVVLGVLYPLAVTGIGQLVFKDKANGERVYVGGRLVGSKLIGQQFTDVVMVKGRPKLDKMGNPITTPDPRYFQSRPSATVPPDNAAATAFSNLGPNSVATETAIAANIQSYIALEKPYVPGLNTARIPVDAANSSASGIDPDISPANARIQAHRIAAIRHLPLARVDALISQYTVGRSLHFFGEPGVRALQLNLALDRLTQGH